MSPCNLTGLGGGLRGQGRQGRVDSLALANRGHGNPVTASHPPPATTLEGECLSQLFHTTQQCPPSDKLLVLCLCPSPHWTANCLRKQWRHPEMHPCVSLAFHIAHR